MDKLGIGHKFSHQILGELADLKSQIQTIKDGGQKTNDLASPNSTQKSFSDHLFDSVNQVDSIQKEADKMATDLATGNSQNIHETMLKATEAELSFNLMIQMRNKALEAYHEIMRMQV